MYINRADMKYIIACKDLHIFDVERAYDGGYDELCGFCTLEQAVDLFNKTAKEDSDRVELCFANFGTIEHAKEQTAKKLYDDYDLDIVASKIKTTKTLILDNGKLMIK